MLDVFLEWKGLELMLDAQTARSWQAGRQSVTERCSLITFCVAKIAVHMLAAAMKIGVFLIVPFNTVCY